MTSFCLSDPRTRHTHTHIFLPALLTYNQAAYHAAHTASCTASLSINKTLAAITTLKERTNAPLDPDTSG